MKTLIQGGELVDPANGTNRIGELWLDGDEIVSGQALGSNDADRVIDANGCLVMPGGIDIHTHIGGGKLAIARMLMSDCIDDDARKTARLAAESDYLPSAAIAAQRYLQMGYTTAFEPAVIPCNARAAHSEMAEMPGLATGGFCVLGNDRLLLGLIAEEAPQEIINQYVAWMVRATQSIAVKVVNAGGISAFKFGQRELNVDSPHPKYGVTPAQVIRSLTRAVHEIGLIHPLHVHCSNLGVPGNIRSTLATIRAADGYPIHLTHAQFHCYDDTSQHGMSSAAAQLAEAMNQHPNVTIDVGQVMFGQTVTISADAPHQMMGRRFASPKKSVIVDIECEAGCGVVPFRYRRRRYVHALQWAIGLELFLMIDDPTRVFLTTDHPNGAPFTAYPHLIGLLCNRTLRQTALAEIHPDAAAASSLSGIEREYSIREIAVMTRSAPAQILGLQRHGSLSPGNLADIAIYESSDNIENMFRTPRYVFAQGQIVIDRGELTSLESLSQMPHQTLRANVAFEESSIEPLRKRYNQASTFDFRRLWISDDELAGPIGSQAVNQQTRERSQ